MYVLEPGESKQVEAASDPYGLKIAIIYDAAPEGNQLFYQRWQVKNESVLTITYMNGGDISTFGGDSRPLTICLNTLIRFFLLFHHRRYYFTRQRQDQGERRICLRGCYRSPDIPVPSDKGSHSKVMGLHVPSSVFHDYFMLLALFV